MAASIALHLIATNKYRFFLKNICDSANKFFYPDCKRHIVIYSNYTDLTDLDQLYPNITFHYKQIEHEKWPLVTLKRFEYFLQSETLEVDYSYYCDVDSSFVGTLTAKHLPNEFAFTVHPLWKEGYYPVERNSISTACIPESLPLNKYICGGFFGGTHKAFIYMSRILNNNINIDLTLEKSYIAINNDESHLNYFFVTNIDKSIVYNRPFATAQTYETPTTETCIEFLEKRLLGGHSFFRN